MPGPSASGSKPPAPAPRADAQPPPRFPPPEAEPPPVRRSGLSRGGLLGTALVPLGLILFFLNHTLPWLKVPEQGPDATGNGGLPEGLLQRGDLEAFAEQGDYHAHLLNWPLLAIGATLVLGVLLFALDAAPQLRASLYRALQGLLLFLVAFTGFFQLLLGARWIGFYTTHAAGEGPADFHLHVVPYLNLAFGLFLVATALAVLRIRWRSMPARTPHGRLVLDDVRVPVWTGLTAALALLLLPLLPFVAVDSGTGRDFAGEATFADPDASARFGVADAADEVRFARVILWFVFYLAWASVAVALAERTGAHPLLHPGYVSAYGTVGPLLLVGFVTTFLAEVQLFDVAHGHRALNFVLGAAYAALALLYGLFARSTLAPFVRHVLRNVPE